MVFEPHHEKIFFLNNLERHLKLQKRAARIILKADFRTPSVDMFRDLGWHSIEGRVYFE